MIPQQYCKDRAQTTIHYAHNVTSLGPTLLAATEHGICFLQFGVEEAQLLANLHQAFPDAIINVMSQESEAQFALWMEALNNYLAQKSKLHALPLDVRGTSFQKLVWHYLQTIPAGQVRSYKEVAEAIGKPKAVRAVGSACANNLIAIAIPCHRVLRNDGALSGYRWGIERKRMLLDLEYAKSSFASH